MIQIESPMLLLDASTPILHTGAIDGDRWLALERQRGDVVTLLPTMARRVVAESGLDFPAFRSLVHCEGPGSLLGLRLCAMMIETWRVMPGMENVRLFAYRSLAVEAAIISGARSGGFSVVTQYGKGNYCVGDSDGADRGTCEEAGLASLGGEVFAIVQRNQKELPSYVKGVEYDLTALPGIIAKEHGLFRPTDRAEAYSPRLSEYKHWDGRRHASHEKPIDTPRND